MKEGQTEHGYTSTIKLLFPEVFLTINDQEYSHSLDMGLKPIIISFSQFSFPDKDFTTLIVQEKLIK